MGRCRCRNPFRRKRGGVSAVRVRVQRAFRLPICEYARPDGCFGLPSHPRLAQCGGDPDRRREKSERCEGGGFNVRCRTLRESSDEHEGRNAGTICRAPATTFGDDGDACRQRPQPSALRAGGLRIARTLQFDSSVRILSVCGDRRSAGSSRSADREDLPRAESRTCGAGIIRAAENKTHDALFVNRAAGGGIGSPTR